MQTIQLTENGLKRTKRDGLFIDPRTLKSSIGHTGTKSVSFRFYFYLRTMSTLSTIKVRKLIQKSLTSLKYYIYYILATQKVYAQHLLCFLQMSGFSKQQQGVGAAIKIWWGRWMGVVVGQGVFSGERMSKFLKCLAGWETPPHPLHPPPVGKTLYVATAKLYDLYVIS